MNLVSIGAGSGITGGFCIALITSSDLVWIANSLSSIGSNTDLLALISGEKACWMSASYWILPANDWGYMLIFILNSLCGCRCLIWIPSIILLQSFRAFFGFSESYCLDSLNIDLILTWLVGSAFCFSSTFNFSFCPWIFWLSNQCSFLNYLVPYLIISYKSLLFFSSPSRNLELIYLLFISYRIYCPLYYFIFSRTSYC